MFEITRLKAGQSRKLAQFLHTLPASTVERFHPHPFAESYLQRNLNNGDLRVIMLKQPRQQIVGYAFLSRIIFMRGLGYFGIVIDEHFRGQGLAKQLIEQLFKLASDQGFKEIILNVQTDNEIAVKLYHKMGFKKARISANLRYLITVSELIKSRQLFTIISDRLNGSTNAKPVHQVSWMLKKI